MGQLTYWNHNTAYYKWIKRWVSDCDTILDVGCGTGTLIGYLTDGKKHLVGVDNDDSCIKRALAENHSTSSCFICCDFEDYQPEEAFDAIIFVASIHHMDMLSALRKAKSLLSSKGILLIVGLADPSTVKDYIIAGLRVLPSSIVSTLKHMHSSEELNIPVSYGFPLLNEVREIVSNELPHCYFRQGLFHRYLVKWQKRSSPVYRVRVQLIACDYAPQDMESQLPITCSLLRMIPGKDRPDYWLAKCECSIRFKKTDINYLILAPRLVGAEIKKGIGSIILGVAYVTDETLTQDTTLDFDKCKYVAICAAREL